MTYTNFKTMAGTVMADEGSAAEDSQDLFFSIVLTMKWLLDIVALKGLLFGFASFLCFKIFSASRVSLN